MRDVLANFCYTGKQYFASEQKYSAWMAPDASTVLAANLKRLMDAHGDTQLKVAKRSGLSQRNVGNVATYGVTHETSPTLRTVDGIAQAYGIPPWALFLADVPLELLTSGRLIKLIENYISCPATAQANIERMADAELRFAKAPAASTAARKAG